MVNRYIAVSCVMARVML